MSCGPLDPLGCISILTSPITSIGGSIVDTAMSGISDAIGDGIKAMVGLLVSWIYIPSDPVCPNPVPSGGGVVDGGWVTACQHATSPAHTLNGYVLPVTIVIAVFGLIWQGIAMAVTRRGEPLLQAIRGLWNSALWGAVGIAGTQLALHASDDFAGWVITTALHSGNPGPGGDGFTAALTGMLITGLPSAVILEIIVGIVIIIVLLIQIVLMIFRDAAIAILAGMLQLAAAGTFTKATSPWLPKVTGWMAALITYKPMAALCYAAGLAFLTDHNSSANFVVGIAVLALSVIALPALMKFFNWTVGAVQSGSSLGVFGAGAAAGMHAAASMRGLGGNSAAEHSRYMADNGPGSGSGSGGSGGPTGAGPCGPNTPAGAPAAKVTDGEFTVAGTGTVGPSMATQTVQSGTGESASSAASGGAGAGAGAAGGGLAAAGGAAAGGASAGAAPVVLGAVAATQATVAAVKSAANSASDSMDGAS